LSRVVLIGFVAGLILLLAAWHICTAVATAQDSVRLDTALGTNLAEVQQVAGTGLGVSEPLKLTLKNLSERKMVFEVPLGLRLIPASGEYADLIVARSATAALGKDETRVFTLVTYSEDPGLLFSAEKLDYSVGPLVDERLLSVLSSAARQDSLMPGQIALWIAVTGLEVRALEQEVGFRFSPEQIAAAEKILAQAKPPMQSMPGGSLTPQDTAAEDRTRQSGVGGDDLSPAKGPDSSAAPTLALLVGLLIVAMSAGVVATWWFWRRTRQVGAGAEMNPIRPDHGPDTGHD
jgi:hypothetical protein